MRNVALAVVLLLSFEALADGRRRAVRISPGPLDEQTLNRLSFSHLGPISSRPGWTETFSLGLWSCCYFFEPVTANVKWTIEPPSARASIDGRGVLTIGRDINPGSTLTIYANIEEGRRIISRTVSVYTPEHDILAAIAYMRQVGEIPCDAPDRIEPSVHGFEEMRFHAGGRFDLTWMPFELYKDYWGYFSYSEHAKTIGFLIEYGNHDPDDFDGQGTFELEKIGAPYPSGYGQTVQKYRLTLRNLWLGRGSQDHRPAACGVVLEGTLYE